MMKQKWKKKHEEEATEKAEKYQEEAALGLKCKRGGGAQQKMDWKLSHQDKCFSAMAQHFTCSLSLPSLRVFRGEHYLQMMSTVVGDNCFTTLTISHLKVHVNIEHNTFANAAKK